MGVWNICAESRWDSATGTTTPSGHSSTLVEWISSYSPIDDKPDKKGYVTNIETKSITTCEVVSSDHDLWHVEQSFRMSKTYLRAHPIFHRTHDAIEAHLTVVFTSLAVARFMQEATGLSLKKILTTLRPFREFVGEIDGHELVFSPDVPPNAAELINSVENPGPGPGH